MPAPFSSIPRTRRPVVPPDEYASALTMSSQRPNSGATPGTLPTQQTGAPNTSTVPSSVVGSGTVSQTPPHPSTLPSTMLKTTGSLGNALGFGGGGPPAEARTSTAPPAAHAAGDYRKTFKYSHLVGPGTARTTGTPPLPQKIQVLPGSVPVQQIQGFGYNIPTLEGDTQGNGVAPTGTSSGPATATSGQALTPLDVNGNPITPPGGPPQTTNQGKVDNIPLGSTRYNDAQNKGGVSEQGYEIWQSPDGKLWERRDDGYYPYQNNASNATNASSDPVTDQINTLINYGDDPNAEWKRDPQTGKMYKVVKDPNTGGKTWQEVPFSEFQAEYAKAKAKQDEALKLGRDNKDFQDWIASMIKEAQGSPELDQSIIDNQIAAQQKRQGYEQGKSLSTALALAARGGMSGEGAGALGADINREFATRGQEMEANTRAQAAITNLQAKMQRTQQVMQALAMAAQNAASKEQRDAALSSQKELMALQAQMERDLMKYKAQLSSPSAGGIFGSILGTLGLGILGPIGAGIGGALGGAAGNAIDSAF